jgi:DNA-binding NtrC family response regulator
LTLAQAEPIIPALSFEECRFGMPESEGKRLLVVSGDAEIATRLREVLPDFLHLDVAATPDDALRHVQQSSYAVALVDFPLPHDDSGDFLERLSGHPDFEAVVLISTAVPDQVVETVDPRRVHGIIRKPFDPRDVASIVRSCVEIRASWSLGKMCLATFVAGSPLLVWMTQNRW